MYTNATRIGQEVQRGDEDWYKICSVVIETMEKESIAERADLIDFLIDHMLDELKMNDMLLLLNGLDLLGKENVFESKLKRIIEKKIITINSGDLKGILVNNNISENKLMIKVNGSNRGWSLAQPLDINDFKPKIDELKNTFLPAMEKMNEIVGFMSVFRGEEGNTVFKVKDLTKKRNKGARCDQSGKEEALKILNKIVDEGDRYYMKKTKDFNRKQVCIIQEIFLRLYNKERKEDKVWFLSAVEANLIEIEKI